MTTNEHPLTGLVKMLEQVVTNSEDDFMSLGMNLQKVQMMSSAQRQKIAAAMSLLKADEETGLMQQISSYVSQSQQDTAAAQQTAANLCDELSQMLQVMKAIDKDSHALEKTGLFLHVIGINTGIECSRYSQIESTFKVVANDTINLAEQIRKATNTLLDKSQQASNEQQKTLQDAKHNIASLEDLAKGSKQATEMALGKVSELVDYSISMVNEAEQSAQAIGAEINKVVMGIQFHDNLRQRIEHVNEALLECPAQPQTVEDEQACTTYLSVELQKAQLDNLVKELDDLFSTQSQAIGNIMQQVSGLETRLAGMGSEQDAQGTENPVAVLMRGIASLEELNQDSLSLGEKITASAHRAEQIVGEMNDAIQTTFAIANNVKINALNAIIKAAKFGRAGMSLQVLAQGMVTTSQNTRTLISDFNQRLEQLHALTAHDQQLLEGLKQGNSEGFSSQQMQQVFEDFRSELQTCTNECSTLADGLQKEQQGLVFISQLRDAIEIQAEQLGRYATSIEPQNKELLAKMRSEFGKQLEQRYTMNEERAIHQQIRGGDAADIDLFADDQAAGECMFFDDEPAATPSAASDDVDLWGETPAPAEVPEPANDDVELWGDEPAAPAAATTADDVELWDDEPATEAASSSDDVELWGDAPSAPAAEQTTDDSVELWDDDAPAEEPAAAADGNEIELWDDTPAEADPAEDDKKKNKKEDDFGANVELF
ncbi:hypothetical protein SAMN02745165_02209 [Malonomonas rubra DSM 5091]|uniref:Methyl-accepting chemotaxis protein n=1 Tax=Malonomonas rubra DSM 5091 TaxID=1122189 RepID=A0A1M6IQP7_MALRU|nr:hypothetical protein [Malonomonas rubra]SHJ36816.1 hypothetical protein SAMN02745165_02209 [Malonomonas rubra DSM 5091]